jgi:hypothetical protein
MIRVMIITRADERQFGRSRSRRKVKIKMHLKEIDSEDVNWIHLAQDRKQWRVLVNTVTNLRVP